MNPSPTQEVAQPLGLPNINVTYPPSLGSNRALRRLQSAHNLGSSDIRANVQPSLISQHRQLQQQKHQDSLRSLSPARRDQPNTVQLPISSHTRVRSNSDAAVLDLSSNGQSGRRQAANRRVTTSDVVSLDRLIRDGPPDGD